MTWLSAVGIDVKLNVRLNVKAVKRRLPIASRCCFGRVQTAAGETVMSLLMAADLFMYTKVLQTLPWKKKEKRKKRGGGDDATNILKINMLPSLPINNTT